MNAPAHPAALAGSPPVLLGCGPQSAASVPPPEAIGFKAHNLARMAALGLPVPPAFVIGTDWCAQARQLGRAHWRDALAALAQASGLRFGDARRPLLLSVRSGAPVSMPGMMETLLNIGLCDATLPGLVRQTGNPRLAWDAYRRLVASWGEVVWGLPAALFEADLAAVAGTDAAQASGAAERGLDYAELRELTHRHLATLQRQAGRAFPQDPMAQLDGAIQAVFASWQGDKARQYRQIKGLPETLGTAVTVQRMVFGNAGGTSGAGVGFTRHPSTGAPEPWVDFLFNAQGEDVVSGRRSARGHDQLASVAPQVWASLVEATQVLETEFTDMQDFEFTVEEGCLYLLQTRAGKRTPQAAARIALDLFDDGRLPLATALQRTEGLDADSLALARVVGDAGATAEPLAQAASACTGVACGEIALDEARARQRQAQGVPVLLLRAEAETGDIAALEVAQGLLTQRGARTSHAAVVARQLGKVCLVGCEALQIDLPHRRVLIAGQHFAEGDPLTLDGNTGLVYAGTQRTVREADALLLARLAALRAAALRH
ncbi:PEP/pyruvate-binding domain-containing protein [Aquabacterium sp. OR-4]|uniref:PEP/pyruvate-binding domain-containing protein n=1 Tax=Aquabacterium sp. OR-4 TaxID=2978127 RepID=UPI0028CAAA04|nr:PEP/pyruvate-binding domain-containing protein [Aquabacterium sp. OR-4]MDT7838957.1 PEP/pyruvate-binding domain-containing protein [Aquabacterium sp. OR-4]